jgi:hypothetical protein
MKERLMLLMVGLVLMLAGTWSPAVADARELGSSAAALVLADVPALETSAATPVPCSNAVTDECQYLETSYGSGMTDAYWNYYAAYGAFYMRSQCPPSNIQCYEDWTFVAESLCGMADWLVDIAGEFWEDGILEDCAFTENEENSPAALGHAWRVEFGCEGGDGRGG